MLEDARLEPRRLDHERLAVMSRPRTRANSGRSTSTDTRGRLRQPSSAVASSSESHSSSGLAIAVGVASGPGLEDEQPVHHAELGGGQPDADRVVHDRDHPLGLALELGAEAGDLRGARLQHRVAEGADLRQRRRPALARLLVELRQPLVGGPSGLTGSGS